MSLVEHYDVPKALSSYGADDPLRVRILPWRSRCNEHCLDAHVLDAFPEEVVVDRIPVPDQEPWRLILGKRLDDLLSRPLGRRIRRDVEVDDLPALVT